MAGIRLHNFWSILRNYVLEANTDTHREQFRCILLYVYSKRRAVQRT